jgi:hypothetical protein
MGGRRVEGWEAGGGEKNEEGEGVEGRVLRGREGGGGRRRRAPPKFCGDNFRGEGEKNLRAFMARR